MLCSENSLQFDKFKEAVSIGNSCDICWSVFWSGGGCDVLRKGIIAVSASESLLSVWLPGSVQTMVFVSSLG